MDKLASHYADVACQYYRSSNPVLPTSHPREFPNKDVDAFSALENAGQFLSDLAGWAIDHQAGKVALKITLTHPLFPQGMAPEALAEVERLKPIVRSHQPEEMGAQITREELRTQKSSLSIEQQRQFLANILYALNGGLNLPLLDELVEGLRSLNVGEVPAILQPEKRSRNWTRAHCQLKALEYVEFWRAFDGAKSAKYFKHVKDAFDGGAYPDDPNVEERIRTARRYKVQAIKYLGLTYVEARLSMARNQASYVRAGSRESDEDQHWRTEYSLERLNQIGVKFRQEI